MKRYSMVNKFTNWITNKRRRLAFKLALLRVRRTNRMVQRYGLRILKFCLKTMNRIGCPANKYQNETLKRVLKLYDEIVNKLDADVDRFRTYVWEDEGSENETVD